MGTVIAFGAQALGARAALVLEGGTGESRRQRRRLAAQNAPETLHAVRLTWCIM